jgi:hypothetical protein
MHFLIIFKLLCFLFWLKKSVTKQFEYQIYNRTQSLYIYIIRLGLLHKNGILLPRLQYWLCISQLSLKKWIHLNKFLNKANIVILYIPANLKGLYSVQISYFFLFAADFFSVKVCQNILLQNDPIFKMIFSQI